MIIKEIVEITESYKPASKEEKDFLRYNEKKAVVEFIGWKIVTSDTNIYQHMTKTNEVFSIYFVISNDQDCCEEWGCLCTNDTPDNFIGAYIETLEVDPPCLPDEHDWLTPVFNEELEKETTFITIKTSKGDLQFTAYTMHNGYYSHIVKYKILKTKMPE